ncbi:hypothetical protein H2204_001977 [Knufia peltigerae]|uniref:Glycosyl transferase family 25 domain-containing protein n=1 Tax=Knufia peltigerae TaxID=1002370 RepID=A0AA38YCS6_9EURO|nr:hypothetical protein H2204_001977 [Knufia peltigerae]
MSTSIFYSNKRVVVGAITALAFLLFLILVGIDRSDEVTAHTTTYFQRLKNMTSTNSQPSSEQWATMKAYLSEIESAVKGLRTPALSAATVPTGSMEDIMNRTLGVGLPFASILERRDNIAVQASLSNIDMEFVDGVPGDLVDKKSLPWTMDQEPAVVGCWRAHMDVLQMIVAENIQSALIFEDDADWDIGFRAQLKQLARGAKYLQKVDEDAVTRSPYGDSWDMLWLGHCGQFTMDSDKRRFVITEDPTVEPTVHRKYWLENPDMSTWDHPSNAVNDTRIIFRSSGGSLAISLAGARKALFHMSLSPFNAPVDWGYDGLCKNKDTNALCISPYPAMIGVSRPIGPRSRSSDISVHEGYFEHPVSNRTSFSTRLNMKRLINGSRRFKNNYNEEIQLTREEIGTGVGHPEDLS